MNTIFVQIASYRDPQLIPTINSMLDNAKDASNLHVGICWQHGDDETIEIFLDAGFDITGAQTLEPYSGFIRNNLIAATYKGAKFTIIDVPHWEAQGACWARNQVQQVYSNEKYTLQLDSHHRFIEHWDFILIDMIEKLRPISSKPCITAYIPSFDPENDPDGRVNVPWKMDFDRFIPEGAVFFLPSSIDDHAIRTTPLRARFYSGHFTFADGSFAVEVQHDPDYFFHGEEISIAARAFTHGYDLYHPHVLVAWHEYTRKGRTKVWDDHTTDKKKAGKVSLDWVERNDLCHRRNRILFGMDGEDQNQIDFGKYGFGTVRTLREYEEYAGISFKYRGVQQDTLDRKEAVYPPTTQYADGAAWKDSFVGSHDLRVCIHKNDLGPDRDYDFWYLGAHDADGEIFRKDVQPDEILQHMAGGDWLDFRFIFLANRKPTSYTLWPSSKTKGWLDKIERSV